MKRLAVITALALAGCGAHHPTAAQRKAHEARVARAACNAITRSAYRDTVRAMEGVFVDPPPDIRPGGSSFVKLEVEDARLGVLQWASQHHRSLTCRW